MLEDLLAKEDFEVIDMWDNDHVLLQGLRKKWWFIGWHKDKVPGAQMGKIYTFCVYGDAAIGGDQRLTLTAV